MRPAAPKEVRGVSPRLRRKGRAHAHRLYSAVGWMDGGGKPSHRRSLQQLPRGGSDRQHPKASMKPGRNQKTVLALNKKSLPLPPLHAKGSNCSPVRMDPDVNPQDEKQHRKSTRRSSHVPPPEHQPQECFGLLECIHNNIQVQTQIAHTQLSLLEDMRETMNVLLSRQERQSHESAGQSEQHPPKGSVSSPRPLS
ncbi:TSSK6-activating co-chaperone protein isoform X3 [Paroedura picta]|uniref:TSSK6-activating co-chaperone protein isoform X3 n=1 Tax=Paroedura picta TaxID=143630 RepID=UPI0040577F25